MKDLLKALFVISGLIAAISFFPVIWFTNKLLLMVFCLVWAFLVWGYVETKS